MANRYWVGGTALWDGTALLKWAASSGGVGGQTVPTSTDDVFFDAASTGTCTIAAGATGAKSINCTGFTGTLTGTQSITVSGNIILVSGMTYTYTGTLTLNATASITSAGKTFGPVTISGTGITVTLSDNLTLGTTRAFIHTEGSLDLNGKILSTGSFTSTGTTTRSIIFGSSSIEITGSGGNQLNMATGTNFTYTGTPTFNLTYSSSVGTRNIRVGNTAGITETNAPTINVSAGTDIISFSAFAKNVNFTGFSGTLSALGSATVYGNLTISSGMTLTAGSNAITFAATSGTQQITTNNKTLDFPITFNGIGGTFAFQDALTQGSTRAFTITNGTVQLKASATSTVGAFATSGSTMKYLQSTTDGTQATISQASGTVNATYLTIKDINATGGATWNAYYINSDINAGNNTGWDFLVQVGRYIYSRRKNKVILT